MSGYLHDLSQLIVDPLIPFIDNEPELIDGVRANTECQLQLSESTSAEMELLTDITFSHKAEADTSSFPSPSFQCCLPDQHLLLNGTTDNTLASKENVPLRSQLPLSLQGQLPGADHPLQNGIANSSMTAEVNQPPHSPSPFSVQGHFPNPHRPLNCTATSTMASKQNVPPSLDSPSDATDNYMAYLSAQTTHLTPSLQRDAASSTILTMRTTEDVIADLKRPRHYPPLEPAKRRFASPSVSGETRGSVDSSQTSRSTPEPGASSKQEDSGSGRGDDDDSEGDDQELRTKKPRKISERRRNRLAVVEAFVHDKERQEIATSVVKPEEEAAQSAKWLVNQSESRQIISTPREYQVELFDRAKEKNIIAVLDTGE